MHFVLSSEQHKVKLSVMNDLKKKKQPIFTNILLDFL